MTARARPLRELFAGRALLFALVRAELKASVRGAALHYFWWLLDPLLMMAIYVFVVDMVLKRGSERYPLFLFCALLPWKAFSNSLGHAVNVMRNSQRLLLRVRFPRAALPVSVVGAQLVYMGSGFLVLLPLMLFYGVQPTPWLLLVPLLVLIQLVLTTGVVLTLSIFGAWFKDAGNFASFLVQLWFFASPAIYSFEQVPAALRAGFQLNPMTGLLSSYRALIMDGAAPPWHLLGFSALFSAVALGFGALIFARFERDLPKII